jgi:hypothetical protein
VAQVGGKQGTTFAASLVMVVRDSVASMEITRRKSICRAVSERQKSSVEGSPEQGRSHAQGNISKVIVVGIIQPKTCNRKKGHATLARPSKPNQTAPPLINHDSKRKEKDVDYLINH